MNSKSIMSIAIIVASFPVAKLISFPLVGATLFSIICAVFIGDLKLWKTICVFLPLYLLLMVDLLFSMPQFIIDIATFFDLPIVFRSQISGFVWVFCELIIMGLSKLLGARKLLKKIGLTKRLGDFHT